MTVDHNVFLPIMHVDSKLTLANLYALLWWIRHTEAGYYANVVGYYA